MEIDITSEEETINVQLNRLDKKKGIISFSGGLISLFISLSFALQLKILFYWLPASFTLLLIWSLLSFRNIRRKTLTEDKAKENIQLASRYNEKTWKYGANLFIKNLTPLMKSVAIIFSINILIILLHLSELIRLPFDGVFEIVIVAGISLYFIFTLLLINNLPEFLIKKSIPSMKKIPQYENNVKIPSIIRKNLVKILVTVTILLIITFIILYFWTIIILFSLIENFWFLITIVLLQFIVILLFYSFFSFQLIKSELEKALLSIQNIKNGEINSECLLSVVRFCRYKIDNIFKFLDVYLIIPHIKYIKHIQEKE